MKPSQHEMNSTYGHFLAERFLGKKCCYIRFDLNLKSVPTTIRSETATKIARKFRNNLSKFYYGNAARHREKFADVLVHLHPDDLFWHLHIVAEIPDDKRFQEVKDFTNYFVAKNFPLCVSRANDAAYFDKVNNPIGAVIYNGKYGFDTLLVF